MCHLSRNSSSERIICHLSHDTCEHNDGRLLLLIINAFLKPCIMMYLHSYVAYASIVVYMYSVICFVHLIFFRVECLECSSKHLTSRDISFPRCCVLAFCQLCERSVKYFPWIRETFLLECQVHKKHIQIFHY